MRGGVFALLALASLSQACQGEAERAPSVLPDARQAPPPLRFLDRSVSARESGPPPLIDQAAPSALRDRSLRVPSDLRAGADGVVDEQRDQRSSPPLVDRGSPLRERDAQAGGARDGSPLRTLDRAALGFPCAVSCDCLDGFSCVDGRCQLGEGASLLFCCSGYCPAGERCESEAGALSRCAD